METLDLELIGELLREFLLRLEREEDVAVRIERFPLGVVASITPFNFPNMVPNWSIPNAIALGNCMILKPSEAVPISSLRIAELLSESGLPERAPELAAELARIREHELQLPPSPQRDTELAARIHDWFEAA